MYAATITAVPVAIAVKDNEHEPETNVHAGELKNPFGPVSLNETTPVGMMAVPGEESDTVAVQEEVWFTTTGLEHKRLTELARKPTATFATALVLPLCATSPP